MPADTRQHFFLTDLFDPAIRAIARANVLVTGTAWHKKKPDLLGAARGGGGGWCLLKTTCFSNSKNVARSFRGQYVSYENAVLTDNTGRTYTRSPCRLLGVYACVLLCNAVVRMGTAPRTAGECSWPVTGATQFKLNDGFKSRGYF